MIPLQTRRKVVTTKNSSDQGEEREKRKKIRGLRKREKRRRSLRKRKSIRLSRGVSANAKTSGWSSLMLLKRMRLV
jgi:hypothetical protein